MHTEYMKRCLELAQRGNRYAAPNPMVGAVLVYDQRIIGEGWHQQYGKAHAEVNCLDSVSDADRHLVPESTMYVSLEPCAHFGKTPPCANRLVAEKVKKVVIANIDPFEKVDGSGISILQHAGIDVESGVLQDEGKWMNRRFFCTHQRSRPYIILKWAASAEGNMAPADRSRTQLSNHFSSDLVQQWRTRESAIMVGFHTALHDNPRLTARTWDGPQPLRIVLDRNLELPASHHLFNQEAPTWVINAHQDKEDNNIRLIRLPFDPDLLPAILRLLHEHKKLSLIVEGGPALLYSFIEQGLWDEARIFKTLTSVPEGIAAPALSHANLVLSMPVDTDQLQLWTNKNTAYPYVNGMAI